MAIAPVATPERTDAPIDASRANAADFAGALLSTAGKNLAVQAAQDNAGLGPLADPRRKDDQKETVRRARAVTDPTAIASAALATHAAPKATTQAAEATRLTPERPATRPASAKPNSLESPSPSNPARQAESRSPSAPIPRQPAAVPAQSSPSAPVVAKAVPAQPAAPAGKAKVAIPDARVRSADAVQALARLVPQTARVGSPQSAHPNRSPLRLEVARGAQRAAASKQPAPMRPAPKPEQPEDDFAAQLSKGFSAIMRQNGGSLTLRLQPEALGDMTIRMDLKPGKVAAAFEVESDQARKLLDGSMTSLRSALEAKGLSVDSLTVHVSERPTPEALVAGRAEPGIHHGGAGTPDGGAAGQGGGGQDRPIAVARSAPLDDPLKDVSGTGSDAGEDSGGAHTVRLVLDAIA